MNPVCGSSPLPTRAGRRSGYSLRDFVRHAEAEGARFVTVELAMRWALRPIGVQRATYARRLGIVRAFAAWLQPLDARTEVPPPRLLPAKQLRPAPHIYNDKQVADLMTAARQLRSKSGLRGTTYNVLIGLLAATGLRPGEALALDVADVDLVEAVLAVRNSKFGKSRLVPMSESVRDAMAAYASFRDTARPGHETTAFLVTEHGMRLTGGTTRRTFARLCQTVGLRPPQRRRAGRGPRLHDLRHTFATSRLVEWYRAGEDVNRLMPRLATYLGHASMVETYWYIQAVPELLHLAVERLEAAAQGDEP